MARGTDLHPYYQRGLNWAAVTDLHFAWVKVSDGGKPYVGTQGGGTWRPDTLVAGAGAHGVPVGGYCYAQPESKGGSPEHQADVLAAECRRLGAVGVAPMMDLEEPGTVSRDFGVRSCNQLAARGFRPAVYMNSSAAKAVRPDQWNVPGLVIVIARYGARPEAAGGAQYTGRYDVHQYTDRGSLSGSLVDLDESYTTTLLNPTLEEDMALTQADASMIFWGTPFDGNANFAQYLKSHIANLEAGQAALAAAVAAATKDPQITVDALKQIVTDAVVQHVQITGDVHIGPATPAAG